MQGHEGCDNVLQYTMAHFNTNEEHFHQQKNQFAPYFVSSTRDQHDEKDGFDKNCNNIFQH